MNTEAYFRDMNSEFQAAKDKIRNLIGGVHWPSDGAWKESILRSSLRRYLPPTFTVGSGFIVTPDRVSTQIDVMVCDDSAPFLFRDGDFLIVPADCVRAIVEVKTTVTLAETRDALTKLSKISRLMRERLTPHPPFIGLFSFGVESDDHRAVLEALQSCNGDTFIYPISALCLGDSQFFRFWEHQPDTHPRRQYDSWHAYSLPQIAPGYFMHNLIEPLFPRAFERAQGMWFPPYGKELHFLDSIQRAAPKAP